MVLYITTAVSISSILLFSKPLSFSSFAKENEPLHTAFIHRFSSTHQLPLLLLREKVNNTILLFIHTIAVIQNNQSTEDPDASIVDLDPKKKIYYNRTEKKNK